MKVKLQDVVRELNRREVRFGKLNPSLNELTNWLDISSRLCDKIGYIIAKSAFNSSDIATINKTLKLFRNDRVWYPIFLKSIREAQSKAKESQAAFAKLAKDLNELGNAINYRGYN